MRSTPSHDAWFFARPSSPAGRVRLICFPHAGGGASSFRQWPSLLPPDVDACLIQLPGRENRLAERPFSHVLPLVETLVRVLEPVLHQPFALFGHSMGALVAFELARALRASGAPQPIHLLVAGRQPPQMPNIEPPIGGLPDDDFLAEVRRLNGTSDAVLGHPELMRLMTPLLRADIGVCETYQYADAPPLQCPLSVFAARSDAGAPPDRMAGWSRQTTARCRLHTFIGDHFFVQREAAAVVARVARDLAETMETVERGLVI
jgi:medium-chain acyl-[acyl-carrier-protein] hydrolase